MTCERLEQRRLLAVFSVANFNSIQEAIDAAAAAPGADVVTIGRGRFAENLSIQDAEGLVLRGIPGRNGTVLDGGNGITIEIANSPNVEVRNLTMDAGLEGVVATGAGDLTLRNVNVSGQSLHGVRIDSAASLTLDRGSFESNVMRGILVQEVDSIHVQNVRVVGNGHDGLAVMPLATQATIVVRGGRFDGNGDDGLDLRGETITVNRASATGNVEDGIQASQATSVTLLNVKSVQNTDGGIDLDDIDSVLVTGAMAKDNGTTEAKDGFDARNVTSLTITRGLFAGNTGNGLDLNDIGTATATSVRATSNGQHGLAVDEAQSVRIVRGTFTNNDRRGLDLDGSVSNPIGTLQVDRVIATGNSNSGMEVNFANSLLVTAGRFQSNLGNGMRVETTPQIDVQRVNASRNRQDGLIVVGNAATQLTITAGVFSRNLEDGIDVLNVGSVLVSRARGFSNQDDGIEVLNANTVDLPGSRFAGNGDDDVSII